MHPQTSMPRVGFEPTISALEIAKSVHALDRVADVHPEGSLMAVLLNLFSEDPVEFLANLLMECVSFREGRAEPPLLYKGEHIEDIFKVLDPLDTGTVTMYQYRTGVTFVGILSELNNQMIRGGNFSIHSKFLGTFHIFF
jgi:ATP phosphoribosyltransferase regulatory subunit HisZ